MLRAALYARFSDDKQRAESIADQLALCRQVAARLGARVVAEYSDAAVSGFAAANRPGLQALLAASEHRGFDVVIAEALDRLSRSGADSWAVYQDLEANGVRIVTASGREVDDFELGVGATMNARFLKDLAAKTRRGLAGVAREGRHAGGRVYGYARRRGVDAKGEPIRGELAIDAVEATVVRRIFAEYAAGASPRAIVARLNAEAVPGPRSAHWNASTVNGNAARGNGVLHNELYRGQLVWGRQTWVKDRRTGKRRSRLADPANAVRVAVPDLRIVDEDLWTRAQARYAQAAAGPMVRARRPKHLLSGLLRCGGCGGPLLISCTPARAICSARRERGAAVCANGRTVPLAPIEARVVEAVRGGLLHPDVIASSIEAYRQRADAERLASGRRRAELERQLAEARRRAARLVDQVADGHLAGAAVADRLAELETERADLERELATIAAAAAGQVETLHPRAAEHYGAIVAGLKAALEGPEGLARDEARAVFRRVVRQVTVTPLPARGQFALAMSGDLADLLALNAKNPRPEPGVSQQWVRGQDLNL